VPSFVLKQVTSVTTAEKLTLPRTVVPNVKVLFEDCGSFPSDATVAEKRIGPGVVAAGTVYATVIVAAAPEFRGPKTQLMTEPPEQDPVDGEIAP